MRCKSIFFTTLFLLLIINAASFGKGFKATIFFADGKSLPVAYFGYKNEVHDYKLTGYIGKQRVSYRMSELKAVIFAEYENCPYGRDCEGTLIIENKQGKRFTLTDANIGRCTLCYFYLDPVTGKRKNSGSPIMQHITHVEIGKNTGELKKNPETGEFFPAQYSYDPYTGAELIWTDRSDGDKH